MTLLQALSSGLNVKGLCVRLLIVPFVGCEGQFMLEYLQETEIEALEIIDAFLQVNFALLDSLEGGLVVEWSSHLRDGNGWTWPVVSQR